MGMSNTRDILRAALVTADRSLWLDPEDAEEMLDDLEAVVDQLVEFVTVCATGGYISTGATARGLLGDLGIKVAR